MKLLSSIGEKYHGFIAAIVESKEVSEDHFILFDQIDAPMKEKLIALSDIINFFDTECNMLEKAARKLMRRQYGIEKKINILASMLDSFS